MSLRGDSEPQILEIRFDGYSSDGSVPWATISSTVDRLADAARAVHNATNVEAPPLRVQLARARDGSIILALIAETLDLNLKWVAQNVVWEVLLLVLGATIGQVLKKTPTPEQRAADVVTALRSDEVRRALSRMLAATAANGPDPKVTLAIPGKSQLTIKIDKRSAALASATLLSPKGSIDVATSEHIALVGPGSHGNAWLVQWRNQNREAYVRDRKLRQALERGKLHPGQILFVEIVEQHFRDRETGEIRSGHLEIRRLLYPKKL